MMKTPLVLLLAASISASCNARKSGQAVDRGSGSAAAAITDIGDKISEIGNDVWVIFQDRRNNYWFGSNSQGVYRHDGRTTVRFTTKDGLAHDRVLEIKEDKAGNMYFNTVNGVSKFDGQRFTTLAPSASPAVWKLEPDDLWFRGARAGPYRYDGKQLHALKFPKHELEDAYYARYPGTTIDPYDIYYIYEDRSGAVWFGTGALGMYRYDGKSIRSLYEEHLTLVPDGGSFGIRSILEDRTGKFWICNTRYRYSVSASEPNAEGKGLIAYTREPGIDSIKDPMGGDRIYFQSIAEDRDGALWLQTYRGGIWRYDGKKLRQYAVKDGAADVNVISMYQDRSGGLWLGTESKGVYRFTGKEFERLRIGS